MLAAAIATREGSWLQSVAPMLTDVPLRSGHCIATLPHVSVSPLFQMCSNGTVYLPSETSLSISLFVSAIDSSIRCATMADAEGL